MVKKSLFVGAGAVLLAVLFFGRDACSYLSTSIGWMRDSVKESVPIEFELERARQMIKDLDPEIRKNMHEIAKEEVEVAKLSHEVGAKETKLAQAREEILQLKTDLDEGHSYYVYAGQQYSSDEVQANLKSRFERFKTEEATTDTLHKMLAARETGLTAARQKLTEMRNAKEQLKVDVANLESRLKMVEVAQTTSEYNFDDSKLSRTKELIGDIGTRIEVAEKLVNADVTRPDDIPVGVKVEDSKDISKEVADYFGAGRSEIDAFVNSDKDAATAADKN